MTEEIILENGSRWELDSHYEYFAVPKKTYYKFFNKRTLDKEISVEVNEGKIYIKIYQYICKDDDEWELQSVDDLIDFYDIDDQLLYYIDWDADYVFLDGTEKEFYVKDKNIVPLFDTPTRIIHCKSSMLELIEKLELEWAYSPKFGTDEIDVLVEESGKLTDKELVLSCNLDWNQVNGVEDLVEGLIE